MRTVLTLLAIVVVSIIGVGIACLVNAPKWMDGAVVEKQVASPAKAPVAATRPK